MGYYRRVGEVPRKRHIVHRGTDGGVLIEELMGSDGFSAESALLQAIQHGGCGSWNGLGVTMRDGKSRNSLCSS